jgi:hypothetical protein
MMHFKRIFLSTLFISMTLCIFQNCTQIKEPIINSNNVQKVNQSAAEILYFIDKKEISKDSLDSINPTNIQSINVVKKEEEIIRYTNKKVAGIIIIKLKK